mgnify:CR=1 FL=1
MRIGLDVSPLVRPHPPGVVRAADGLAGALITGGLPGLETFATHTGVDGADEDEPAALDRERYGVGSGSSRSGRGRGRSASTPLHTAF